MMRTIAAFAAAAAVIAGPAIAGETAPLTTETATRFVATLDGVQALGKEFDAEGKLDALEVETKPKLGEEFKPYSNAVTALKAGYPAEHARLAALVKPQGFSTEEWGAVGDRVMLAYLAEKMEAQDPGALAQMEAMDPSMMEMMPPQMREQMAGAIALAKAVRNAPEDDRKAIKPVMADLDAVMESE
ncbi:MAG: hypothetical protein R3C54_09745 [Parvularculaceae bacterium]